LNDNALHKCFFSLVNLLNSVDFIPLFCRKQLCCLFFFYLLQTRNGCRLVSLTSWLQLLALWSWYQYSTSQQVYAYATVLLCKGAGGLFAYTLDKWDNGCSPTLLYAISLNTDRLCSFASTFLSYQFRYLHCEGSMSHWKLWLDLVVIK